ncbi:hypothetical protein AB0175_16865, partial [Klebsiella pneumoniae]
SNPRSKGHHEQAMIFEPHQGTTARLFGGLFYARFMPLRCILDYPKPYNFARFRSPGLNAKQSEIFRRATLWW